MATVCVNIVTGRAERVFFTNRMAAVNLLRVPSTVKVDNRLNTQILVTVKVQTAAVDKVCIRIEV